MRMREPVIVKDGSGVLRLNVLAEFVNKNLCK